MKNANIDHWEDFTTVTEWEKLIQFLSTKLTLFHSNSQSTSFFHFIWKRHNFKVQFHSSSTDNHYIGILTGKYPFIAIELDSDSQHTSLLVCCNEARLLISAWLLATKESKLESIPVFCSFSIANSLNYVGYLRQNKSLTHFISHSFPFIPENTRNVALLLDWCYEKQKMISSPETELENLQIQLVTEIHSVPFPEKFGIFLADEFNRIFAIGAFKRPIKRLMLVTEYKPTLKLEKTTEHVVSLKLQLSLLKLKEKSFIFTKVLTKMHFFLQESLKNSSSVSKFFPPTKLTPLLSDDFMNLFIFLFNGKTDTFATRLADCTIFLLQKEHHMISKFWDEFCIYLRESWGSVVTRWCKEEDEEKDLDELGKKLLAFEKYCNLLIEEREEAKSKDGKKELIETLSLWEPFTISSNDQLISPKLQLFSDMQAFKAANSSSSFEDFIRWYSPNDWLSDENCLSSRMSADTEWRAIWDESEAIPIYEQSFADQLQEFLHSIQELKMSELIKFCTTRSLKSFIDGVRGSDLFCQFAFIQERVDLLDRLIKNFSWSEYFIEPWNFSLDEIVEQIMQIELYTLVVEYLREHFDASQIQQLILEGCCDLKEKNWDIEKCEIFKGQTSKNQIVRVQSSSLQVYARIEENSFDILEGQSETIPF